MSTPSETPQLKSPAKPGEALAESALSQSVGRPAVDALRRTVGLAMVDVFGSFIRKLPETLRQSAASQTVADQRYGGELAKLVEAQPERWISGLIRRVDANLIGSVNASRQLEDDKVHSAGDELMLTRIELRAEAQFSELVTELSTRLDSIRRTVYFPVRTGALAPAGLCRALQDTATEMKSSSAHVRVLFGKFDELVFPELPRLYQRLISALSDIEIRAEEAASLLARETARAATLRGEAPAAGTPAAGYAKRSVPVEPLDPKTNSMLVSVAATPAKPGEPYSDRALASDLLTLQTQEPLPGVDIQLEQRWIPLQRISLAGKFLNEVIADPLVSGSGLGPQHESVRFPLLKSALADSTLFTAVTHPLRSLVNDLMLKAATSRVTGTVEARQMAETLQQVLVQFDLAPDFVREAMLNAQPINEEQINSFFNLQKQQARQRTETVIHEAKRLVIRELELRTFGRDVPEPALKFLNTNWGPILVKGLLQHGADNVHWRAGMERMEEMLTQLSMSDQEMPPPQEWQDLVAAMGKDLADAGMPADRIKAALEMLNQAWQAPQQRMPF
ncbi:MAG TPA: DUF1631 family protein [Fontimonas sp.]